MEQRRGKFEHNDVDRLIHTVKDGFKGINQTLGTIASNVHTLSLTVEKIYQQQMSQQLIMQQQSLQLLQYQQEIRELIHNKNTTQYEPYNQEVSSKLSNYDSASNESFEEEHDFELKSSDLEEKLDSFSKEWNKESENIEYCTRCQIRELVNKCKYGHLFASQLMEKIFKPEEFEGCNVYGIWSLGVVFGSCLL